MSGGEGGWEKEVDRGEEGAIKNKDDIKNEMEEWWMIWGKIMYSRCYYPIYMVCISVMFPH